MIEQFWSHQGISFEDLKGVESSVLGCAFQFGTTMPSGSKPARWRSFMAV
jgi:hypothetical protein